MRQPLNKVHCSEQSKKAAHNTIASCKQQCELALLGKNNEAK